MKVMLSRIVGAGTTLSAVRLLICEIMMLVGARRPMMKGEMSLEMLQDSGSEMILMRRSFLFLSLQSRDVERESLRSIASWLMFLLEHDIQKLQALDHGIQSSYS